MSEDEGDAENGRGKMFPASSSANLRNKVVSLTDLKKLNYEQIDDFILRATVDHWPDYQIDYYKEILVRYSEEKSVSPQQLYDQIMEPEIRARIRDYQARHGVPLSVVEARPNPGDNGRDLIRKWLHTPSGKIARGFLKFVRRFIQHNYSDLIQYRAASESVLESRRKYHSESLHDMSRENFYRTDLRELFEPNQAYTFLLEHSRSIFTKQGRKLFTLNFHESGIGYFLIYALPKDRRGSSSINDLSASGDGLILEYQGYLWTPQRKLEAETDEIRLHVVLARKLTKTTSMPPCHPFLLSDELKIQLQQRFENLAESDDALRCSGATLTGGTLDIQGLVFPEMYRLKPKLFSSELMAELKKLEGIQINV